MRERAPLSIIIAAAVVALVIGLASYVVMQAYYDTHPFWAETAPYQRQNLMFLHLSEESGRWSAAWEAVQFNDRHLLRGLFLLVAFPELLSSPHAHLFLAIPSLALFLALFAWTVYRRSGHLGYAIGSMAVMSGLEGMVSEQWGIGAAFADFPSALLIAAAVLCLINASGRNSLAWVRLFAVFLSLGVLTRMPAAVTAAVIGVPAMLVFLIATYRKNRSLRSIIIPLLNVLVIAVLLTGFPMLMKWDYMQSYYTSPNAYSLGLSRLQSLRTVSSLVAWFMGAPIIAFLLVVFVFWFSARLVRWKVGGHFSGSSLHFRVGQMELMIMWWALGFVFFLTLIGYWSDVPKEVMYVVPAPALGALSPMWVKGAPLSLWSGRFLRLGLVVIFVFGAIMFVSHSAGSLDRARAADGFQTDWRRAQLEMAKVLSDLPDNIVWQSYTSPDWGGPVTVMTYYTYERLRLDAGPDYFSNKKSYWDSYYPGLSLGEVQETLYGRTKECVDAAIVLKDPTQRPKEMEDYSYSIASYMSERVQSDSAWRLHKGLTGGPFASELAVYVKSTPSRPECFQRALRNLKLDGQGHENPFSKNR